MTPLLTTDEINAVGKIIVAVYVAYLTHRQKKYEHDLDVWFAKQRAEKLGCCWTTQMRKRFRFFRRKKVK